MRRRRTREEMDALRAALVGIAMANQPASVRQLYYLAVSDGLIPKTEAAYLTVARLLADARETGALPWKTIVDHTRAVHKLSTFNGIRDVMRAAQGSYRRAMWSTQADRVEVWLEKRTLLGPLMELSEEFDVGLFPCGGYPSRTFLHDAAEDAAISWERKGQGTVLFYLGDHDPSGVDIERSVRAGFARYAMTAGVSLTRLAVTEEQIAAMSLPLRPTKTTDSRARSFRGGSVEVEAIPPDTLRAMVKDAITSCIDPQAWAVETAVEESHRDILGDWAAGRYETGADRAYEAERAGAA